MNTEIFKKDGSLKKSPPKRYVCKNCGNLTSKPAALKLTGIAFNVCERCNGGLRESELYIEWHKRNVGQWDVEEEIMNKLSEVEMTKDELSLKMMHVDDQLFSRSFADLCYWGKLIINKEYDPIKYKTKK